MVKKPIFNLCFASLLSLAALLASCGKKDALIKVGHGGGFLSAALYAAQDGLDGRFDVQQFYSSSDIAYSLLAGALDAGFVDADKLAALSALKGFETLAVVGKITYPYGATLVLRKGLDARLDELGGLAVAVSAPDCVLLKEFAEDAARLNADISGIKYERAAFDAMIPALEAGKADAAIIKGSYAIVALQEGHSILYQNWDMVPGDECCPAVIEQAVSVLLARRSKMDEIKPLVDALVAAQELPPDDLRRAVAGHTAIPFEIMEGQPVPEFSAAGDELVKIFVDAEKEHHGGVDHDDEDNGDE
jgi:ABC-type nitrate/sulfonate/bicarbonate transport system substrate-binding protein